MKRFTALTAAFLLLVTPMTAFAEEPAPAAEEADAAEEAAPAAPQFSYGLDEEGHAELYDFLESDTFTGDLVIPWEIDGHQVDYIGNGCFAQAAGITSVMIPAGITDMGDKVFFGCSGIERFIVEEGNPYFSVNEEGCLLADNGGFFFAYPPAKPDTTYTIPAGVDEIAPGAFSFASHLTEVTIPEGVHNIDNWAFAYSGVQKVTMQDVVQIDDYAFAYCQGLHEIDLGHGLKRILNATFAYDAALTQVTLPPTLTYIGQYAFCGCSLPCVTIPNALETISYCAFGYDASLNAIEDFKIYGEPNTMAQEYATAHDEENDYENHFEFIAVMDASIPFELGGGQLYSEDAVPEEPITDENGEVIEPVETNPDGTPVTAKEQIGAGLKDNQKLQLMLGIGGGVLLVLAGLLVAVFLKKPKSTKAAEAPAPAPEEDKQDETDE